MAIPDHVEIVKKGAQSLEEWRKDNPHLRIDLAAGQFDGDHLIGVDLSYANLRMVFLKGANLNSAVLLGAYLECREPR